MKPEFLAGLERIFRRRFFSAVVGENVAPASSRQGAVDAKRSCPASHAGETPALRFFLTSCTSAVRSLVAAEGRRFENTGGHDFSRAATECVEKGFSR